MRAGLGSRGLMPAGEERGNGIQVIARSAAILRALESQKAGMSLGQIAKLVDLPRSTVQRIVNALEAEQLVSVDQAGGGVRLGVALTRLAASVYTDVRTVARPHVEELARRVGETVDLAVLRGDAVVFVDQVTSDRQLRVVSAVGAAFPLHCTANGKALLAWMTDQEIERLVGVSPRRYTSATRTSLAEVLADVAGARERGYALDREEHSEGISALGVAIRASDAVPYALSVPTPTSRFESQVEVIRREVLKAKANIEEALGFRAA